MSYVFFQRIRKNDNIVDIYFDEFLINSKKSINLSLNIN